MATTRYRTKLCRNFALGNCPQGDHCKYLHSTNIPTSPTYPQMTAVYPPMRSPVVDPSMGYVFSNPLSMTWQGPQPPVPVGGAIGWPSSIPSYTTMPVQSTAPSQPPQYRPLSWRTTLCRHFVKNQGWCPLGDECGYIHDLSLAAHAANDTRFPAGSRPDPTRGRAGTKHSHCWAYVQGLCRVKDCPYLHPTAVNMFVPHTPCLAWPNCTRGALCSYKHPEPLIPKVPAISHVLAPGMHVRSPPPVTAIPSGTVQYNGTTYFPVGVPPQGPAPPPSAASSPTNTWNHSPAVNYSPAVPSLASAHSPYSTDSAAFQSPFYETISTLPQPSGIPRAFTNPSFVDEVHSLGDMSVVNLPAITEAAGPAESQAQPGAEQNQDGEFPYRPQAGQRAGHAKRVSVATKSKEDSDAQSPLPQGQGTARRQSWMGHRQRDDPAHRSWPWAPDFVAQSRAANPQSLQLML